MIISNKLEQLEFKLEKKILGFSNMQEKLENYSLSFFHEENYMIGQIVMKLPRLLSLLI